MNVGELLKTSFEAARSKQIEADSLGALHRQRSSAWVECLAREFRVVFRTDPTVRVFSRQSDTNREDFGVNELLHDVCVCRVGQVPSAVHGTMLFYVRQVLWQVESEFAKNSRETLKDFNKLVCGSARNKLFVGSQVTDNEGFINVLLPAASACSGQVFAALVPHPKAWDLSGSRIYLWQFKDNRWTPLEAVDGR